MLKDKNNCYYFDQFLAIPVITHGFSSRTFSPMTFTDFDLHSSAAVKFAETIGFSLENWVAMNQVHGDWIAVVGASDRKKIIPATDGLITNEKNLYLCIRTGDCAPLLFFDEKNNIIGIAHSGWKGTLKQIARKMVKRMINEFNSDPRDISVGIGPTIGVCCYNVDKERIEMFTKNIGEEQAVYQVREGIYYLDLTGIITKQLLDEKVTAGHIFSADMCTSCYADRLFSRRADIKRYGKLNGENIGIIGLRSNK